MPPLLPTRRRLQRLAATTAEPQPRPSARPLPARPRQPRPAAAQHGGARVPRLPCVGHAARLMLRCQALSQVYRLDRHHVPVKVDGAQQCGRASLGRSVVWIAQPCRRTLGDHQGRRVGVAAGDGGHDAGVGDAQAGDAAHAQVARRPRPVGRRRGPSCTCPPDGRWSCRCRRPSLASSSSLSNCTPGLISSGAYFASAGWATMRRVRRNDSAATWRSSAVARYCGAIRGASAARGERMRTVPRELRVQVAHAGGEGVGSGAAAGRRRPATAAARGIRRSANAVRATSA